MSITNSQYSELFDHISRRTEILRIDDVAEITATAVEWLIDEECLLDEIARDLTVKDLECLAYDLRDLWHDTRAAAHEARQAEFDYA
jgi:hypothetical protein